MLGAGVVTLAPNTTRSAGGAGLTVVDGIAGTLRRAIVRATMDLRDVVPVVLLLTVVGLMVGLALVVGPMGSRMAHDLMVLGAR